jgi:Uri superfamily endonuclease
VANFTFLFHFQLYGSAHLRTLSIAINGLYTVMSAIRRRNTGTDNNGDSGGNQAASIQELDQLHDDSENSIDDEKTSELVCQGDKYYQEAEESGFQKVDPLIKGLKNFVEAAGEGSQNATERLKTFFAEVPSKAQWFIDYMPKDLLAVASTILKGNSAEKEMYRIAKEMFRAMSRGASFIRKDDIEEASQLLLNAEITIDDCGKDISKINRSVKKLLQCAVSKDEKGNKIVRNNFL